MLTCGNDGKVGMFRLGVALYGFRKASVNLGRRGILFEQRNARKDTKKISWKWLFLRECVMLAMKFFRVL